MSQSECAQQSVENRFEMFGTQGRQPAHAHAIVSVHGRSEIGAAIHRDFVPEAGQFMTNLLVIRFDPDVFGNQAASSDESDPYALARARNLWRTRKGQN